MKRQHPTNVDYFHCASLIILYTTIVYEIGTWILVTRSKFLSPNAMSNTTPELGTCPFCGSALSTGAILVEYEVEGETRIFAECSECEEPVQPS